MDRKKGWKKFKKPVFKFFLIKIKTWIYGSLLISSCFHSLPYVVFLDKYLWISRPLTQFEISCAILDFKVNRRLRLFDHGIDEVKNIHYFFQILTLFTHKWLSFRLAIERFIYKIIFQDIRNWDLLKNNFKFLPKFMFIFWKNAKF